MWPLKGWKVKRQSGKKKKKSPIECLRSNTIGDCGSNLKAFLSVYK